MQVGNRTLIGNLLDGCLECVARAGIANRDGLGAKQKLSLACWGTDHAVGLQLDCNAGSKGDRYMRLVPAGNMAGKEVCPADKVRDEAVRRLFVDFAPAA